MFAKPAPLPQPAVLTRRKAPRPSARYRDEIHKARALVVDGNPTTRSVLAAQLRELGVAQVAQCARIAEARTRLETSPFDIVLCEHDFPDGGGTGQQLLDDLRRDQVLPLATVFVMVTSEATYAKVAEAAESALDSYLIKPHNTASLAERLAHARRRKTILRPILEAVDAGRLAAAATLCLQRFRARGEYWLYAARIGSELLLNLDRHEEVRALMEAVLEVKALPWARLGLARAQIEAGELARAVRTLEALVVEHPTYVDAYDVMGRALLEQGDFDGAMEVYARAAAMTPDSVARLQKAGMLACYRGDWGEAANALERALGIGAGSKMFDWQSAVLLAFARYHEGDADGLQRCGDAIDLAAARAPTSRRLRRFGRVVSALRALLHRHLGDALAGVRGLGAEIDEPDFDVEAASHLAALLALLAAAGVQVDESAAWIDRIALRHTGSRIATELLARAARSHPPFADRLQAGHVQVTRRAEAALAHALGGRPTQAVRQLLADAEATLSQKLLETARMTLQRHRARVDAADELEADIEALRKRMAPPRSPLVESNGRKPGALVLRSSRAGSSEEGPPPPRAPAAAPFEAATALGEELAATARPDAGRAAPRRS